MKILSNKKYNDLINKQFRGIFADVNDDNLLRENGLLYGENKELKQEIERLNNIINKFENGFKRRIKAYEDRQALGKGYELTNVMEIQLTIDRKYLKELQELKGSDKE